MFHQHCWLRCLFFFSRFFFLMFIFERKTAQTGEGQREGETQNPKQAPGSKLSAQEPDAGLEPTNCEIMTWAEVGRSTDWATQAPPKFFKNVYLFLRERERERDKQGKGRERETQNLKQAPGSQVSAQNLTRSSNSGTVRSWPEQKSDV